MVFSTRFLSVLHCRSEEQTARTVTGQTVNDHFRRKEGEAVCDKVAVFLQRKKWKRVIL